MERTHQAFREARNSTYARTGPRESGYMEQRSPGSRADAAHALCPGRSPLQPARRWRFLTHQCIKTQEIASGSKHKDQHQNSQSYPSEGENKQKITSSLILNENIFQGSESWVSIPLSLRCQNLLLMEKVKSM